MHRKFSPVSILSNEMVSGAKSRIKINPLWIRPNPTRNDVGASLVGNPSYPGSAPFVLLKSLLLFKNAYNFSLSNVIIFNHY